MGGYFFRIETATCKVSWVDCNECLKHFGEDDYILIDGMVPKTIGGIAISLLGPRLKRKKVVAFISPRKDNKEALGNEITRRLMPPWCLDELLLCRSEVYPDQTPEAVSEYFGEGGGNARYVFRERGDTEQTYGAGVGYALIENHFDKIRIDDL